MRSDGTDGLLLITEPLIKHCRFKEGLGSLTPTNFENTGIRKGNTLDETQLLLTATSITDGLGIEIGLEYCITFFT